MWGRLALLPRAAAALAGRRALCQAAPGADTLQRVSAALGLTEPDQQRLHLAMLEHTELQLASGRAPDRVSPNDWAELLRLGSQSGRRKYFNFLFKREKAREADVARRRQRSAAALEELARTDSRARPGHLRYGLGHNTIFHRVHDATMNAWSEQRLYTAMQFGQPLVLDLGFEANMTRRENKNTAQQLSLVFSANRTAPDPFDLHLCNSRADGEIREFLRRIVPTVEAPAYPVHLHSDSYLDRFPRDKLVYLTPHCRDELDHFDYDAIYIVGGLVDLVQGRPLSLAVAKKEGLKMAKLPLSKYLSLGPSFSHSLTLVAMINILLDLQSSGSWEKALRHVPRRSQLTAEQQTEREQLKLQQLEVAQATAQRRTRRWDRAESGRYRSDAGLYRSDAGLYRSDTGRHQSDAGKYRSDADRYRSDAGRYRSDAGRYRSDAGRYQSDAGRYQSDAGRHQSDAGRHQSDAGRHRSDAGRYQSDAGKYRSDAGRHQSDAGKYRSDAGRHQSDAGRHRSDAGRYQSDAGKYRSDAGRHQSDAGKYRSDAGRHQSDAGHQRPDRVSRAPPVDGLDVTDSDVTTRGRG